MSASIKTKLKGSVIGGVLLITGSCVGAGMLALPVITGLGGFFPSTLLFILAWLFMTSTSLLLLEANLALGHHLSLISIAKNTLGRVGKGLCWILFLFLFYSLSIAYISASGDIVGGIVEDFFGFVLPDWFGSALFTLLFGIVIYCGTRPVDLLNRVLMLGLIVAYFLLVSMGLSYVKPVLLLHHQWKYAFAALPIMVISFGFHNMIPSLADYFEGDVKRLKWTVLLGSFIPLLIYLIWELVLLGIIPVEGIGGLNSALNKGEAATSALRSVVGSSSIVTIADCFALFAIITSFLAQSLSLVDFLSDGLKVSKKGISRLMLVLLTLIPPFCFALLYPGIFISALSLAGGFSAVMIFGVMPVLMVWVLRYRKNMNHIQLLPYGRPLLTVILLASLFIFTTELMHLLGDVV